MRNKSIGVDTEVRVAGGPVASEAQDAIAVDQQPDGGAATAAAARGGAQADAWGQPAAGRCQPSLPAERRQARYCQDLVSLEKK